MPPTGPRSVEGKQRSAQNATTHGLTTASSLLVPGERPDDFDAFTVGVRDSLQPRGVLETALAFHVALAFWRVQRAARVEAALLADGNPSPLDELTSTFAPSPLPVEAEAFRRHDERLGLVARYEAHLERVAFRSLHELYRLRAFRHGEPVSLPAALDADVNVNVDADV